jgi:hypothetical protein
LFGVAQKAHSDPPPPPPDPVTIDPNPFDPYERTDPQVPPPDPGTTVFSYYLYNEALLWLKAYDLDDVQVKTLEQPPNGYTVDTVYGTVGGHSIVWDGRNNGGTRVDYGTYPYNMFKISFKKATATCNSQWVYDVAVDPTNKLKLWVADKTYAIWQSTDEGTSWAQVTGLYNSVGPHLGIAISSDGQRIFVIDKGALSIHYSVDGGTTWDYGGTNTLSLWSGANNPHDVACSSDGSILYGVDKNTNRVYRGTVSCTGGNCSVSWNAGVRPLGNAAAPTGVAVDPNNSNIILVVDNGLVGSYYNVYKSTDGGSTFATVVRSSNINDNLYQVSIDSNGYYWISVLGNHEVYQIRPKPTFPDETVMYVGGNSGTGDYQFNSGNGRLGIHVASFSGQPYLYVASRNHNLIKIYTYDNYESDIVYENEPDDPIVTAQLDFKEPGISGQNYIDLLLKEYGVGSTSITLTWTAPGDDYDHNPTDDPNSRARKYHLKYAKAPIDTDEKFDNATEITGLSNPQKIGLVEEYTKADLDSNTMYYFAIKAEDDMNEDGTGNLSALSNSLLGKTGLLWEWNMVSCPLEPSPDDSNSVFGDNAKIDWMWDWISTWSGAGDPDNPDYDGYWQQVTTITPGKGILLLSYDTMDPTDAPPASTPVADASRTFALQTGWNLIGNPYEESVNLSDCDVTYNSSTEDYLNVDTIDCSSGCTPGNWIGNAVYIWNGSDYDFTLGSSAQLEPWKAYWILACCDQELIIYDPNP